MRTDRGRTVLLRVVERISEISPDGIGHWSPAWDHIAGPSDMFLDALALWEGEDSPATRAKLQAAAEAFVIAWREAARLWEEVPGSECHESNPTAMEGARR